MNYIKAENPICDYLELHIQDAVKDSEHIMQWTIPNSYYSNLQSGVCLVSLAQSSIDISPNVNANVKYLGSIQNGHNTRKNGLVMAHLIRNFDGGTETKYYLNEASPVKILTTARPQSVKLQLVEPNNTAINPKETEAGAGFFILKFEYLDYKQVQQGINNSKYPMM